MGEGGRVGSFVHRQGGGGRLAKHWQARICKMVILDLMII